MHTLNLKYYYIFGILFLLFLNFTYAKESISQHNIPTNISMLIGNAEHKDAILLIDKILQKKQVNLLKTKKTDILKYTSLYDEISELIIMKNKLLMEMQKEDELNTDIICNFILDYEEVEFIKTQYYKTPFHDEVAKTIQNMASLYQQCHPPMAEKYLESILQIKEHIYNKESVESAKAHDALGDYYRRYMANFKRAIKEYEEAKRIREKLYGVDDSRSTENYGKLTTSIYYHGDKTNRAEKLLLNSITMRKKPSAKKDFPLYEAYMDMGLYYSMKNDYANAIDYFEKALSVSKNGSDSIIILHELSRIYLNQDDLHNALDYANKAYIKATKLYKDSQHVEVVESLKWVNEISGMINKKEKNIEF